MTKKTTELTTNQEYVINRGIEQVMSRFDGGFSFAGIRDTKHTQAYDDYGFPDALTFNNHYQMYRRFGIAKAGIKIPAEICWRSNPKILEGDEQDAESRDDITPWERELTALFRKLKLWRRLKLADEYQAVGHYGAFVIQVRGTEDQADWNKPLGNIRASQIVSFIPLYEDQLLPVEWEQNRLSERYAQPIRYTLRQSELIDDIRQDMRNQDINVHHSRVIVFSEGAAPNSIYGVPANEAGYNDLLTLIKIIGATGEGMWKSAAMKTVYANSNPDAGLPNEEEVDAMDEAIADFVKGLDKHLMTGNLDPKVLSVSMMNPKEPFMIALNSYAASRLLASKLLIGAQDGKLASDQDGTFTLSNMQSRREEFCSDMMESVIDWMIEHNVIEPRDYVIEWDDLLAPSDKDKLELSEKMARVNKEMGGQEIFTEEEIRNAAGFAPNEDQDDDPLPEVEEE